MTYPAYNQSSMMLDPNGAITMSGISRVVPIKVPRDLKEAFNLVVKGHEVNVSFTDEPNCEIIPKLRSILLGDINPPAYKAAVKPAPKEEPLHNMNISSVREHIPAEIPEEEMLVYTAKALEYYNQNVGNAG